MLADMSTFVAMLCVCFSTLCDASRLAAACSHNAVGHTEACSDAHSFFIRFMVFGALLICDAMRAMHASHSVLCAVFCQL